MPMIYVETLPRFNANKLILQTPAALIEVDGFDQ